MCGIAGLLRFDGRSVAPEELTRLLGRMVHRGPDDEGTFLAGPVALGMRRLSIIDLSGGHQPMTSADGRWTIVFNGEVYNFLDLRAELERRGRTFRTRSDTEVVLEGWQEWGEALLPRLNGMFGLALWDARERELVLARDRLGKKQVYWALGPHLLVFGSEMATPLEHPEVDRRLSLPALREYLTYGYVGGPGTAVAGISLVPEGGLVRVRSSGEHTVRRWWDPAAFLPANGGSSPQDDDRAAEEVWALLVDAVRQRLVASDVPVALMLSSGLDSSAVAAVLAHELGAPLSAFSTGFADPQFDESEDAGGLARALGLPWSRRLVTEADAVEAFPRWLEHASSLQANTAQFVYWFTCEEIRRAGFKVALNGSGGDELFVGYPTFRADGMFQVVRHLPRPVRRALAFAAGQLPVSFGRVSFDYQARKFTEVAASTDDPLLAHAGWRTILGREAQAALLAAGPGPEDEALATYRRAYARIGAGSPFKARLLADFTAWLVPLMPWIDNVSMAHSIELRLPLLDYRLVEWVLRAPDRLLFRGWRLKRLMKRFLARRLPPETLQRKKRGTHVPLSKWLNGGMARLCDEHLELLDPGLVRPEEVRRLRDEHRARTSDHTFALWGLVVLSAWMERYRVQGVAA